ncbi:hypothetical protein J6590_103948 [Homalodisca vitripennis]|nr:hypothetical protein J6590_103948 [Homalodisca vitripennis]
MSNLRQQRDDVPGDHKDRFTLEDAGDNITKGGDRLELSPQPNSTHKNWDEDLGCCWWKVVRNCLCPWIVPRKKSHPIVTSGFSKLKDESVDDNLYANIECYESEDRSDKEEDEDEECMCMAESKSTSSRSTTPPPPVYLPPAQPEVPNPQIPPQIPPPEW